LKGYPSFRSDPARNAILKVLTEDNARKRHEKGPRRRSYYEPSQISISDTTFNGKRPKKDCQKMLKERHKCECLEINSSHNFCIKTEPNQIHDIFNFFDF
jgi:hypothetical protein